MQYSNSLLSTLLLLSMLSGRNDGWSQLRLDPVFEKEADSNNSNFLSTERGVNTVESTRDTCFFRKERTG
jgi:hypothetical protein